MLKKRYLIGSALLGLSNKHDTDYMIISEKHQYKRVWIEEEEEDVLCRSEEHIRKGMSFDLDYKNYLTLVANYQLDKEIIQQDFPIEYSILDYKDKLIDFLKYLDSNNLLNWNIRIKTKDDCCSKLVYHIAYNIFILQNNSPIITPEQKEIIQKIHDKKMPIAYVNELKKMLHELK